MIKAGGLLSIGRGSTQLVRLLKTPLSRLPFVAEVSKQDLEAWRDEAEKKMQQIGGHEKEESVDEVAMLLGEATAGFLCWSQVRDRHYPDTIQLRASLATLDEMIKRRTDADHPVPVQYLTNKAFWRDLELYVDENCLIPRPETSDFVEHVLALLPSSFGKLPVNIVDVGTGSGGIAIALARATECAHAHVYATDASSAALEIAAFNAKLYPSPNLTVVPQSGVYFDPLPIALRGKIDVIVSNPPYVASHEMTQLQREVKQEPLLALHGGEDGLDVFRELVKRAQDWLSPKGILCVELGHKHAEAATHILSTSFVQTSVKNDFMSVPRFLFGFK